MPFGIDKKIRGIATDQTVSEYLKSNKVIGEKLYICDNLSVYGTDYIRGQYVILPNSTNSSMMFGRIVNVLCDKEFAYIEYRKTSSYYDERTDLHIVTDNEDFGITATNHLADYRAVPVKSCFLSICFYWFPSILQMLVLVEFAVKLFLSIKSATI